MKRLIGLAAVLAVLAAPMAALAGARTLSSSVERRVENGVLRGCSVKFTAVSGDPFHEGKGNFLITGGRLEVFLTDSHELGVVLKPRLAFTSIPNALQSPAVAYLLADGKVNAEEVFQVKPGEPGQTLFVYRLGPVTSRALDDLGSNGSLVVAFALTDPPESLAATDVDIRIKESGLTGGKAEADPEAPARFAACLADIRKLAKPG